MPEIPPEIDVSRPHPARIYDFFLGGKDNFTADREAAAHIVRSAPFARVMARENRAFLGRAVRFLAGEAGIRQFLDIGTGLPTTNNVHEVAQAIAPASREVVPDDHSTVLKIWSRRFRESAWGFRVLCGFCLHGTRTPHGTLAIHEPAVRIRLVDRLRCDGTRGRFEESNADVLGEPESGYRSRSRRRD